MQIKIHQLKKSHRERVFHLYKKVAATPGGLARLSNEVDIIYVDSFIEDTITNGVGYVAINEKGSVVGEVHAYSPYLYCFSHVLNNLTIVVDPSCQKQGIGKKLLQTFCDTVNETFPHITRIELFARESNENAISFYETMGFRKEGILTNRIKNPDGSFEADIIMAWLRGR